MEPKEKIIVTATHMLAEYGVRSIKMDDIASELGMSKRTIYENFTDKKELICACVNHLIEENMKLEDQALKRSKGVIDELFNLLETYDADKLVTAKISYQIQKYYPEIYREYYLNHNKTASSKIRDRLERGIKEGVILNDLNVEFTVYVMIETIGSIMMRTERNFATQLTVMESFKYMIIFFFRGVATQKGIEEIDKKMEARKNNKK